MTAKARTTSVRFDPDVYERLVTAADERLVSVSWLVNWACRDVLGRLLPPGEVMWTRPASLTPAESEAPL